MLSSVRPQYACTNLQREADIRVTGIDCLKPSNGCGDIAEIVHLSALVLLAVCGTICFFKARNDRRVELEETEREAQEERVRTSRIYILNAQP